ncbi:MAG: cell wall hydrolase [Lachnospiraceae bacterium]|nr:cell wall hydrolase [Lachnospiraceae bacterium]
MGVIIKKLFRDKFIGTCTVLIMINVIVALFVNYKIMAANSKASDGTVENNQNITQTDNTVQVDSTKVDNNRGIVTTLTEDEFAIYVAIIYCEVGAESYETKLGVANVILNRLHCNVYPNTLKEVVYDPYQFSPVREGKLEPQIANYKAGKFTHSNYVECIKAAKEAMAGHNNIGDRIGFLTPEYLEKLFAGKYRDKLVIENVAFFNA